MDKAVLGRALSRILFVVDDGGPRHRALRDLRHYQRAYKSIRKVRDGAVTGFVLARRASQGAARPWDLGAGGQYLCRMRGQRVAAVMGWAVAAEKAFGRRGLRITHRQFAEVLAATQGKCSERSAAAAVRSAVEAGWLERLPWFSPSDGKTGGPKHTQRECCYVLTTQFRDFLNSLKKRGFARSLLASKKCQPAEIQKTHSSFSSNKTCPLPGVVTVSGAHRSVDNSKPGRHAAATQHPEAPEGSGANSGPPSKPVCSADGATLDPDVAKWSHRAFAALAKREARTN